MKQKPKIITNKLLKLFLVLLMIFSCVNHNTIQNVNAVTLGYQSESGLEKSVTIDDLWGDSSSHTYKLKIGGEYGFCLDMGQRFSGGKYYDRNSWSGVTQSTTVKKIMNWFYDSYQTDYHFWLAQTAIWGIQKGKITNPYDDFQKIWTELDKVYNALHGTPAPGDSVGPDCRDMMNSSSEGEFYIYTYETGYQRVASNVRGMQPTYSRDKVDSTKSYSTTDQIALNINKTDVDTGAGLGNVEFELYRDNSKITTVRTNNEGKVSYTFEKEYSNTGTASAIYCNNYDELSPKNKELIGEVNYTSRTAAQNAADKEALAKAKAEVQKLLDEKHTYKAVETKTKNAYYLDSNNNTWTKEYASGDGSGSVSFSITNKRQLGTINITKLDSETNNLVDQAIYGLYAKNPIIHPDGHTGTLYAKDELVATFPATATNGKATLNNLYLGDYYVKEINAPDGYVLNTKKYDVILSYAGQEVSITDESVTVDDKVQRGQLNFVKEDRELNNGSKDENIFDNNHDGAQGDATLQNATYGIYALEPIVHADGTTGVVQYNDIDGSIHQLKATKGTDLKVMNTKSNANTLLATIKTDANGEFGFANLYNGKYYVKEIEPSDGYLLDTTQYNVDISYTNENQSVVIKSQTVLETVKKQAFEVLKVGHVSGSSGVVPPLKGVEFTVKLESDVMRLGWDNAPTYDILVTDEKGRARSIDLPSGTYRVRETKTPLDYATADDFFVTITEDSREPQEFTNIIVDEMFSALVKAVKLDEETGKTIHLPDTTFKIKALTDVTVDGKKFSAGEYIGYWNWNILDGFYTDTWKTNEDGYVIINEKLSAGEYQLEEIHAPYGYILDETPIKFKVTNANMYETSDKDNKIPIITVHKSDVPVKGQVEIYKKGEVLTGYDKDKGFIYEERYLPDMEVGIYAEEDILDPSNDGTILYQKDELIETLITGESGKVVSSKLPLGKYYSKEIKAPNGFVLSDEIIHFELEYADENTSIIFESIGFVNERQKVNLSLLKKDTDDEVLLEGGEFDFIANEDITNVDGDVIVEKGTVLSHVITNEDGKATVDLDLPLDSEFVFVETKAPYGYILDEIPIEVTTSYAGQDIDVLEISKEKVNEKARGNIQIRKVDSFDTSKVMKDVEFNISRNEDMSNIIATAKTDENSITIFEDMEVGTYYIQEAKQIDGYVLNDHIYKVEITTNGELITVEIDNKPTEMEFSKVDETGANELEGAEVSIIDPETNEIVEMWVSGKEPHKITYLVEGKEYIFKEDKAPLGYNVAEEIKFVAGEGKTVTMQDDLILTDIQVNKVDAQTNEAIVSKDFEFTMYADKELTQVLDVVHANTEDGTATFKDVKPLQTVYIKETKAPVGYKLSTEVKEIKLNDELDGYGDIHSFVYMNSLLPVVVVKTNDTSSIAMFSVLVLAGLSGTVYLKRKKKE